MHLIITLLLTTLAAWLLNYGLIRYSEAWGLLHQANSRSSHTQPTPCGGGAGIALAFIIALTIYTPTMPSSLWWLLIGGGGLLAAMGLLDDHHAIPALSRLTCQGIVVIAILWIIDISSLIDASSYTALLYPVLFVLLLWWLNLYNFMDGIDGIAAIETLSIGVSLLFLLSIDTAPSLTQPPATVLLLLLAATSGFLLWNWAPAKIFMGDAGSLFLGFILAVVSLWSISEGGLSPWSCLLLGGVFFVDATVTLLRRMLRRERWYQAHRSHAYQRLSAYLISKANSTTHARTQAHRQVCYGVLAINGLWLLPWAWVAQIYPGWGIGIVIIAWMPLVGLVEYGGRK